jgi:hypothetical protein
MMSGAEPGAGNDMGVPAMKKALAFTALAMLIGVLSVLALGVYRFNFTDDDIFRDGSAIGPADGKLFHGTWGEPNPINSAELQGFTLNPDGSAQSLNMATLRYKSWRLEPGKLILVAESVGNRVSSTDATAYDIVLVGAKRLELKNGEVRLTYTRVDK